jgi:2'-5' RNA ligase
MSKAPLMRVFYVVYPDEPELCAWLNLLRALANPHEKEPAHVTVRGPYRQRYRLPQQAQGVRGTTVHVPGADAFLSERQSTVILRCQAEQLRALWRKPDYPGFTPHLTVCDGLPRALSEEILDITRAIPPFSFRVGELQPIFSKPKQTTLGLLSAIDRTLLAEIAGERLHAEALLRMATPERLRLLRRAVAHGTQGGVLHAAHPPRSTPRPPDPQKAERESP